MKSILLLRRAVLGPALIAVAIATGSVAVGWVKHHNGAQTAALQAASQPSDGVALAPGTSNTLIVPSVARQALGVQTAPVQGSAPPEPLVLSGSLLLDSSQFVHVHTRFGGEVIEIATVEDNGQQRPLRMNDKVTKGQVLAVIWSKEVGEKKSDLVDSLSQLWVDEAQLKRLRKLERGVVPEKQILEAERNYEKDVIDVDRMERTLRSWRLTEEEIEGVKKEALRIHSGQGVQDQEIERTWAEVDVRAPFDGSILEKNIAVGDIVDTNLDLFKIANLSRLAVLANIYEEDLPALERVPADARVWKVNLKAEPDWPPILGRFDLVGNVIDPNQHTGTVMGWVDNNENRLRVGQFITATIELPPPKDEVTVPVDAVIDQGDYAIILVADDSSASHVTERKVIVAKDGANQVCIRNQISDEEIAQGISRLEPGELVVVDGNVELVGALRDLRAGAEGQATLTARAP